MTTYEEWRVTARIDGQPYEFTWSPMRNPYLGDSETAARGFIALMGGHVAWEEGPYLHRRTVTLTEWEPMDV